MNPDKIHFHVTVSDRAAGQPRPFGIQIEETGHVWAREFSNRHRVDMLKKLFKQTYCNACPLANEACSTVQIIKWGDAHTYTLEADAAKDIFNKKSGALCMKK